MPRPCVSWDGTVRPSPHGEGGLKYLHGVLRDTDYASLPTRGGWIEIKHWPSRILTFITSLPTRGGWIEMVCGET